VAQLALPAAVLLAVLARQRYGVAIQLAPLRVNRSFRCRRYARPTSSGGLPNDDPLVAVHEWPGVATAYAFLAGSGGDATLELEVAFDPAAAGETGEALASYGLVQEQLADPRTAVVVATSLAAEAVPATTAGGAGPAAALAELVAAIVASLDTATGGSPPAPVVLTAAIPVAYVAQIAEPLFPVQVAIDIGREGSEESATSSVPPTASTSYTGGGWAPAFEAAYSGFDGSGGLLKLLAGESAEPGQVWALKWGAGHIGFGNAGGEAAAAPVHFARRPLATRLVSGEVELPAYGADGTPAPPRREILTGVDVESLAGSFLGALDRLLAPELSDAMAKLDGDLLESLTGARADVADGLAAALTWVFEDQAPQGGSPGAGDLEAARTHLREALVASLETDLAAAAVVQLPATVKAPPGSDLAARLVGTAGLPGTAPAASLPLADGTWPLTLPAGGADPAAVAHLPSAPALHLTGLELGGQGRASSRLRFLVRDKLLSVPMGRLDVPLPLRAYPPPPRLLEHSIAATHDPPPSLAQSVEASYALTLASPSAAQDDLHLSLVFNEPALEGSEPGPAPASPLFEPLARFQEFVTEYGETAVAAIVAKKASAGQWLRNYVARVQDVAASWPAAGGEELPTAKGAGAAPPEHPAAPEPPPSPDHPRWDFVLWIPDRTKPGELMLRWTGTGEPPEACWPAIEGAGGAPAAGGARAYTLGADANVAEPRLVWPGLSVVTHQSATATARVVRNESLAGWSGAERPRSVDPSLVYHGPTTTFQAPAVPQLVVSGRGLTIRSASLGDGVSQLVTQVLQPPTPAAQVGFGVEVSYSYALAPAGPATSVPVLQGRTEVTTAASPPPELSTPQQLARALEEAIASWHRELAPAGADAALLFSVTLFAPGGDHPLVRLTDVQLPAGEPGWWPA
jgi:hypothetical protein